MSGDNPEHVPRTLGKLGRVAAVGPGSAVLEVGCGLGRLTAALAGVAGHVTGIDISAHAVAGARRAVPQGNVEFHVADALTWKSARRFDLILAMAVFEHFAPREQERFLNRARRWLAPGGRLVLHVPIGRGWSARRRGSKKTGAGEDYTGDPTHRAVFTPDGLRRALVSRGWRIEREWVRLSRWGWPAPLARAAQALLPRRVREEFAMEMMAAAVPEKR